ncbi:MAG: FAD-binding oxidoreductase [Anaerolineales bacterium]|nr:FAD-binding oxidoreductase [Anaerolineales bacterium]
MKLSVFWTDQYPRPDDLPTGKLPAEADVAIVGSGYTGLNAALALGKAGLKAVVLEQETIGWGASSRNGSMLTPGLKADLEDIERWYGREKTLELWQWSVEAVHYVAEVIRDEGIACDFQMNGQVYLASKPSHAGGIRDYGELLKTRFDYDDVRWVSPDELRTEIGSRSFHGALIHELGARLHPAKYTFGLARAAARYGASLVEHARVKKIASLQPGFLLETARGRIKAQEVLLATGGYTTNLVPKARQGIFPVGSYIIVTEPLPIALQKELSPKDRVFYTSNIFLNYFCLTPDGRMLLGGRENLSTRLDLERSARDLHGRMLEFFPQLEGVPLTHSWNGRLGVTFDQMPHVGQADGIYYAYGYSGHGITIGSYLGKEVGELLAGIRQTSVFLDINHPRTVFARLDRVYLPFVSQYFKFRDAIS